MASGAEGVGFFGDDITGPYHDRESSLARGREREREGDVNESIES